MELSFSLLSLSPLLYEILEKSELCGKQIGKNLALHSILSTPICAGYLFQNNRAHGIRLSRLRKLQEALYLACEHGYLNIALELRSIVVMWNLNFWTR